MRNKATREAMTTLLRNARYEVLPTPTIEEKVLAAVPVGTCLTVTASVGKGLEATLALSESFARAGYDVVPHLAARMVGGRPHLEEIVARLRSAGVTKVFVPGGDAESDHTYPDALALLEDLTALGSPFGHVGIAGYPESHPSIDDDITIQSMWDKRKHATHVVSNMTFDAKLVLAWVERLRRRHITLPLLLGMPGPIDRAKLLSMATKIGIGESTKFLVKQKGVLARLTAPGGFTGEKFLEACARGLAEDWALCEGLHLYTFNQVEQTERWRRDLLAELAEG